MCAVLIGGMDRLHREYIETAKSLGVVLKVFNGQERKIEKQIGQADMLILCTGKVSHSAKREAIKHAGANKIPVSMMHSAGISALRCCIEKCPLKNSCACCGKIQQLSK
ncbi:MAG: DUF2325 domain-containing protein [Spirochaetaceae bacterium]|jgi:hypothetical protein|nr:DUF2325 domain-containing protein [Spirochaetaceae bacterium]